MKIKEWESPWLRQQVQTHIVFGLFSKFFDVGWIAIVVGAVVLGRGLLNIGAGFLKLVDSYATGIIAIVMGVIFIKKFTRYHQASIGWISTKVALGIGSFLCMTLGAGISFANGQPDALANFLIGLIWLPGVEFIPRVTPYQKWVSIGRLLLSIPVVYLGVQSGCWKW